MVLRSWTSTTLRAAVGRSRPGGGPRPRGSVGRDDRARRGRGGVQLWSDEVEGMRDEARQVVAAGLAAMAEAFAGEGDPPADLHERARHNRRAFEATYQPVPEAETVELAGVRCRVLRPDGPVAAVYLHFHGGGMILGAPEMNEVGNLALARRVRHGGRVRRLPPRPRAPLPRRARRRRRGGRVAAHPRGGAARQRAADPRRGVRRRLHGGRGAAPDPRRARRRRPGRRRQPGVRRLRLGPVAEPAGDAGLRPGPTCSTPRASGCSGSATCRAPRSRSAATPRSPRRSPTCTGWSPRCFSVGSADHLLDDTLLTATRWAAAGNSTELFVAPDMPHGFQAFPCGVTRAWARAQDAWFAGVLGQPAPG